MPTRFKLPGSGTATFVPATRFAWSHIQGSRVTRPMATTNSNTAFVSTAYAPDSADHLVAGSSHIATFLSPPLAAQTIAAQAVSLTVLALEANAGNNLFVAWHVYAVDANDTLRGTLVNGKIDGTTVNTSIQSRTDSTTSTAVTVQDGDRLVLEVGFSGTPTNTGGTQGHNGTLRFGDLSANGDLAANDTGTTDLVPWIEFANTLSFLTGILDTFTRANSTTALGTSESGHTWTNFQAGIISNAAYTTFGGSGGYGEGVLTAPSSDGVITATWAVLSVPTSPPGEAGILLRRFDSNNNAIRCILTPGPWYTLQAVTGGVQTAVAQGAGVPPADGDVWEITYNGTAITWRVNGAVLLSGTTSEQLTQQIIGFYFYQNGISRLDRFQWQSGPKASTGTATLSARAQMAATATRATTATVQIQARGRAATTGVAALPKASSGTATLSGRGQVAATTRRGSAAATTLSARGQVAVTTRTARTAAATFQARGHGAARSATPTAGAASVTRTSGADLTPGLPDGWLVGDVFLLLATSNDGNATLPTPSGWALLGTESYDASHRAWLFWRRAQAGDIPPVLAPTLTVATAYRGARIYGVGGVPSSAIDPIDAWSMRPGAPTTTAFATTDVATTTEPDTALTLVAYAENPSAVGTPTGWTQPPDALVTVGGEVVADSPIVLADDPYARADAASGGPGLMLLHEYRSVLTAGAAGAGTVSITDTNNGAPAAYVSFVVALKAGVSVVRVSPTGIGTGEAFGTASIAVGPVGITPAGIVSGEAFGAPVLAPGGVAVSPTGLGSSEAFGAPTLAPGGVAIIPAGIGTGEALGAPVLVPGGVAIVPIGIGTAEALGAASVQVGAVSILPVGIPTAEAFGLPNVPLLIITDIIPTAEAFGALTVVPGTSVLLPNGLGSGEAFGAAIIGSGVVSIAAIGIATAEALGTPVVVPAGVAIVVASIPSLEAPGAPVLVPGGVTVTTTGIASLEALGAALVAPGAALILPSGLSTAEAFGAPSLTVGPVSILPVGMTSAEAFGLTLIQSGVSYVAPSGIASVEAFGGPLLVPGATSILPLGLGSLEAFGASVLTTLTTIAPSGLGSLEMFGAPSLISGAATIAPLGLGSLEAFGAVLLDTGATYVLPTGVASAEAFAVPSLIQQADQDILAVEIPSAEAFGTPYFAIPMYWIAATAIGSEEAFGRTVVVPAVWRIFPAGLPSIEAFGAPRVDAPFLILVAAIPSEERFGQDVTLVMVTVGRVIRVRARDAVWGRVWTRDEVLGTTVARDRAYGRTRASDAPG